MFGAALASLALLDAEGRGPFDFFFIDADKQSNADYFDWALRHARRGAVIVVDNVVRGGAVIDADSRDPSVQGVRRLVGLLAGEVAAGRVTATALQTVGTKGHDGLIVALVTA